MTERKIQDKINVKGFLYEEDGSYFRRNEKGQIEKIPINRFHHGQIVKTAQGHYSPKEFVRLIDPTWVDGKGWWYGENFIDMQGSGGGVCYSNPEELFTELLAPDAILFAERVYLKEMISLLGQQLKVATESLGKIEFALKIAVPDFESKRTKCIDCAIPITRNSSNCNIDKCDNCYPAKEESIK